MKKSLCITTYVSGKEYIEFIPVYIYSILKSYPNYGIIIFCGESLPDNVRNSLDYLNIMGKFTVIENYMEYIPKNFIPRKAAACKRWLVYSDEFLGFECLYIGDIDIFILPEETPIHIQHLKHCETIGLGYSNIIRHADDKMISGLHFIKTKQYISNILPVLNKYKNMFNSDKLLYTNSEYMLYDMIKDSGLGLCPKAKDGEWTNPLDPSFRPLHGIHLAVFRDLIVKKRRINSDSFKEGMKILVGLIDDPVFKKIENNFESKMIKRIFRKVHKFNIK